MYRFGDGGDRVQYRSMYTCNVFGTKETVHNTVDTSSDVSCSNNTIPESFFLMTYVSICQQKDSPKPELSRSRFQLCYKLHLVPVMIIIRDMSSLILLRNSNSISKIGFHFTGYFLFNMQTDFSLKYFQNNLNNNCY